MRTVITHDLQDSVRQIRRRLFVLLTQAFSTVLLLTVVFLMLLAGMLIWIVLQDSSGFEPGVASTLKVYYAGRGSWDGVGEILLPDFQRRNEARFGENEWTNLYLLDGAGRVVIDKGQTTTPLIGQIYQPPEDAVKFLLQINGQPVGTLMLSGSSPQGFGIAVPIAVPVIVISFFTGTLTLIIGFLLVRRVVTPLADVIAAAQAVASGDLAARVQVRGPGDLRSLSDWFNHMADTLERNDHERRNLLADIAHELRTPLTVIRGRLEGILDGVYPVDESHIAPVLEETYVLERLVEDLRLLTLAEAGELNFDKRPTHLGELAERAVNLFHAEAEEKNIQLSVQVSPETPMVMADPQRVGQVIDNLLNNAIRYVPENGQVSIEVKRAESNGRVMVAVRDNGPGVPEVDLPKLFDRFWRGEKSRARAAGGAGLGLAIARQLIEAQGGKIAATNLAGGGLEVYFVL